MIEDKITDMTKITLGKNDVMLVRVDVQNMPRTMAESYMNQIKEGFQLYFLSTKIIVVPDRVSVSIIGKDFEEE